MQKTPNHIPILFAAITAAHLLGMYCIDIMDVDAAQYASISREMALNGEYLQVQHHGSDYLDKPPLLFWLAAFSFKILGVSNFAYRLPAFLFTLLGVYSTYRLGKLLYDRGTGLMASLMLYTCVAWWQFTTDVRTDTMLAGAVIFSIWQLVAFLENRKWHFWLGGFVGMGLAMLAKGPIGAVVPAMAIGSYLVFAGRWKDFLRWQWLPGIALTLLVLSPMLWGLYLQYGTEGIYFYFWKQSFGRITGENDWKNDSGHFFFAHTFLWSFLPWSLLALYGLAHKFRAFRKEEMLSAGGFLLPILALSLSHYKLPHYIFVVYPLAAILAARGAMELYARPVHRIWGMAIQTATALLLVLAGLVLCTWSFPMHNIFLWAIGLGGFGLAVFSFFRMRDERRLWLPPMLALSSLAFWLNGHLFPTLLKYQAGSEAAFYICDKQIPKEKVHQYLLSSHALDFYGQYFFDWMAPADLPHDHSHYLLTNEEGRAAMDATGRHYQVEQSFDAFKVTGLKLSFLDPGQRQSVVGKWYLLKEGD